MSQQERSSEVSDWLNTPIEQMTPEQLKALDDMVLSEERARTHRPNGYIQC